METKELCCSLDWCDDGGYPNNTASTTAGKDFRRFLLSSVGVEWGLHERI